MKIKKEIMEKVSQITEKYNLDKKIIVAYSGGKDSFFFMHCFKGVRL